MNPSSGFCCSPRLQEPTLSQMARWKKITPQSDNDGSLELFEEKIKNDYQSHEK
jgi:hypothetical protein